MSWLSGSLTNRRPRAWLTSTARYAPICSPRALTTFSTGETEDELLDHVLDAIATVLDVDRRDLDQVKWSEYVQVEAIRERQVLISA